MPKKKKRKINRALLRALLSDQKAYLASGGIPKKGQFLRLRTRRRSRRNPDTPQLKAAYRYLNLIRNKAKRRYGFNYLGWLKKGGVGPTPERYNLSVMGAQAVRLQLKEILGDDPFNAVGKNPRVRRRSRSVKRKASRPNPIVIYNPASRGAIMLYKRVHNPIHITAAERAPGRNGAGGLYKHTLKAGVQIWGLPNGDLLFKHP